MKNEKVCEFRPVEMMENQLICLISDMHFYQPRDCMDVLHTHNCLEIGFCIDDEGLLILGWSQSFHFSPGTIAFVPSNVCHNQFATRAEAGHWQYLCINEERLLRIVPARYQQEISDLMARAAHNGLFLQSECDSMLFRIMAALYETQLKCGKIPENLAEMTVMLLLTLIAETPESSESQAREQNEGGHLYTAVEPALIYINRNYKEEITMGDLARVCSLSESRFRAVFTRCLKMPPLTFLNTFRIHRAMRLLETTCESVQNIAMSVGFTSMVTFNRNFRNIVGQSPTEWRNRLDKKVEEKPI